VPDAPGPLGISAFRWAWLTDEQKQQTNIRLEGMRTDLLQHAEALGIELRGPIFIQGSSLWLPEGRKPGDIDLIVPPCEKKNYEALTRSSDTGGTKYDIQDKPWENARSGMVLLVEPCLEDDHWEEDDWEAFEPVWAKGIKDALTMLTPGDKFTNEPDSWKKKWKNHKARLESLIYLAQYFAEFKEVFNEDVAATIDEFVLDDDSAVTKLIYRMNKASLEGVVENNMKVINDLTEQLALLYGECQAQMPAGDGS